MPWKREPLVVALGASCQCTYQIRRFTGVERASYFDWLGVPHDGLVEVLRRNFEGCFLKENLRVARNGSTIIDSTTGISYRHAFGWVPGHPLIDVNSIETGYEQQRHKYAALQKRWREDTQSRNMFFVRQDSPTVDQMTELLRLLAYQCLQSFRLLVITHPEEAKRPLTVHHPRLTVEYADTGRLEEFGWKGSDEVWDRLLGRYLGARAAAQASPRPIVARDLHPNELRR